MTATEHTNTLMAERVQPLINYTRRLPIPVWRTIKLGTGPTTCDGFDQTLTGVKCKVDEGALEMMKHPSFQPQHDEVDLAVIPMGYFFMDGSPTLGQFYAFALENDLQLCPPILGPELRLHYMDQAEGEQLFIAMEPLPIGAIPDYLFLLFTNAATGERVIRPCRGGKEDSYGVNTKFVFIKTRK